MVRQPSRLTVIAPRFRGGIPKENTKSGAVAPGGATRWFAARRVGSSGQRIPFRCPASKTKTGNMRYADPCCAPARPMRIHATGALFRFPRVTPFSWELGRARCTPRTAERTFKVHRVSGRLRSIRCGRFHLNH